MADPVACEVQGAALAHYAAVGRPVLGMDRTHPRLQAARADRHAVADAHLARHHRAGDDGPCPTQAEAAVDRQPETPLSAPWPMRARGRDQRLQQGLDPLACRRRHRQQRRLGQRRGLQRRADVLLDRQAPIGLDQVDLGQGDQAPGHAQQIQDRQVFAGLGHHPIIGGDDQQGEVDP